MIQFDYIIFFNEVETNQLDESRNKGPFKGVPGKTFGYKDDEKILRYVWKWPVRL